MTDSFRKNFLAALALLLFTLGAGANAQPEADSSVASHDAEFLQVDDAYRQDILFSRKGASAIFQIAPGYYLYRDKLALYRIDGAEKTPLPLDLPEGEILWDDYFEKETEVYRWQLQVPLSGLPAEGPVRLEVHYQGCADAGLCYPPQVRHFSLDLAAASATATANPGYGTGAQPSVATAVPPLPLSLGLALMLAFASGLLLNLMPCVFPVLSIKLLSIAGEPGGRRPHGWTYSAGVILSFVLIAALMLALRAGGQAVGWGFQLQSPVLIATLAYLFFAMGLGLSGAVEFGGRLMGLGSGLGAGRGPGSAFASGVRATVEASPCTAPLMGSALGFAVTQPAAVALSVFAVLGAGMAAPFLLLVYIPALADRLPRPGPWMDRLKQLLAFPMYLTAVWLLWVLGRQTGTDGVAMVLAGGVAMAFALWLWPRPDWHWGRGVMAVTALAAAALPLPRLPAADGEPETASYWRAYSPERLANAHAEGRPLLVNMTAAWCITCLANDKMVLASEEISDAMRELDVVALKGDWTNQDPNISEFLARYGRTSVPLYLLYPADGGEAKILPQVLTRERLLVELRTAARPALSASAE